MISVSSSQGLIVMVVKLHGDGSATAQNVTVLRRGPRPTPIFGIPQADNPELVHMQGFCGC